MAEPAAVTGPARDEHVGGAARDETDASFLGGAEAGVSGVLVHDVGDGVVAALNIAAVLADERVVALLVEQLAAAAHR